MCFTKIKSFSLSALLAAHMMPSKGGGSPSWWLGGNINLTSADDMWTWTDGYIFMSVPPPAQSTVQAPCSTTPTGFSTRYNRIIRAATRCAWRCSAHAATASTLSRLLSPSNRVLVFSCKTWYGRWNDRECTQMRPFICKIMMKSSTQQETDMY